MKDDKSLCGRWCQCERWLISMWKMTAKEHLSLCGEDSFLYQGWQISMWKITDINMTDDRSKCER